MDVAKVRAQFPIFAREIRGHPLTYLDTASSSQKPTVVLEAMDRLYREHYANVHRGVYLLSEEATDLFEGAREVVARFLRASEPREVVFTHGTTESLNLLASSLGRSLSRGDRVLTTIMEHHSNIVPWHFLRESRGIELAFLDIDEEGRLREDQLREMITPRTKVVTLTHVSNVLGTVNRVREVADLAHDRGAIVVLDAAQSAAHHPIDVTRLGVDFLTFSGHKTFGPTGIGVLWGRGDALDALPPFFGGGDMIREVHVDRVLYREAPARFEAGTPHIAGAVGLAAGLRFLESLGWDEIEGHEADLTAHGLRAAKATHEGSLRIYGPTEARGRDATFSFSLKGIHPHDVASLLDVEGIAIRSGHHCAQPLMERLGVGALSRASASVYNTRADLDRLFEALTKVRSVFEGSPVGPSSPADVATSAAGDLNTPT
jgi:cysteine desulfurase / selenocysteine lyase